MNLASVSEHVSIKLWNLLTQLIQFTDLQVKPKRQQTVEKKSFYVRKNYFPIKTICVYLDTFKM